jgi:hypothetical protein
MESWILSVSAALVILYIALMESIDWAGRYEYMQTHFPKLVKWAEKQEWRVVLLLIALTMQGRVLWDFEKKTELPREEWMSVQRKNLEEVRNQTFTNQEIELDGKHLHDCNLVNSTLIYRGKKPYVFEHNLITGTLSVKVTDGPQQGGMALFGLLADACKPPVQCIFQAITPDGQPMPTH